MGEKKRLVWTLNIRVIAIAVLAIIVMGGVSVYREHALLQETLERDLAEFEAIRRQTIRDRTLTAKAHIDFLRGQVGARLGDDIRERVEQAHDIADNIVRRFRESRTPPELLDMVREALRPIRWRGGRGYFFLLDSDGINRLQPPAPEFEGTDLTHHSDPVNRDIVSRILNIVGTKNSGFLRAQWPNPTAGANRQEKLIFVKRFAPLGLIIGSGEYLADFESELKAEALERIETMRFDSDEYIFAGTWKGVGLTSFLKGMNVWDDKDVNGVYMVRELIAHAKADGGFVEYVLPDGGPQKPFRKISFAVGIPEWEWFIGTGTSLQDIETEIAKRRDVGMAKILRSTLLFVAVIGALLAVFIVLSNRTLVRVQSDYRKFADFLDRAATDNTPVGTGDITFAEFAGLADAANRMVADRSKTEQALRESEARFNAFIDHVPVDWAIKGTDGRFIMCNRSFEDRYGPISSSDGSEHTVRDVFPSSYAATIEALDRKVLETRQSANAELLVPRRDGQWFEALVIKFPVFDGDGKVSMLGAFTMDISMIKNAERDARQLQDEIAHMSKLATMGEMAASISHELNQPLLAISNFAAGCRRRIETAGEDPLNLSGALQRISDEANRAGDVIRTIRDMSRKRDLTKRVVRIDRIIHDVVTLTSNDCNQNGIELQLGVAPDLPNVAADPVALRQVLINLVRNGIEACADGSVANGKLVAISARLRDDDGVAITVRDTGTGMTEDQRTKVFDAFFTTKSNGTGLGLAICRRIIEAHGGKIDVASRPGAGTEFTFWLPVGSEPPDSDGTISGA